MAIVDIMESYLVPQVTVNGTTLTSQGFPKGRIKVDSKMKYVGRETFILYKVARCEIHLFADADKNGRIHRLYWFQFEGYLPNVNPRTYDYSCEPSRTMIGSNVFYESVRYFNVESSRVNWSDDSDTMHMLRLLERNGLSLEGDLMRVRLVRLDGGKEQELMIIYMESLDQFSLSIGDFDGADRGLTWRMVSDGLRTRALAGMKIDMN
jgi:hypothetical protein